MSSMVRIFDWITPIPFTIPSCLGYPKRGQLRGESFELEPLLEEEVEAGHAIFFSQGDYRPFLAERPLYLYDLRVAGGDVSDIGESNIGGNLLFHRQAGLRVR